MKIVTITLAGDIPDEVIEQWQFEKAPGEDIAWVAQFSEHVQIQPLRNAIEKNGVTDYMMAIGFSAIPDDMLPVTIDLSNASEQSVIAVSDLLNALEHQGAEIVVADDDRDGPMRYAFWNEPQEIEYVPQSGVGSTVANNGGENNE
jgi:hypothetical protein